MLWHRVQRRRADGTGLACDGRCRARRNVHAGTALGKGFLTCTIDETTTFECGDFRLALPRFSPESRKANQVLVDVIGGITARKQATAAQIALAWLLAQKPWIVPIPGTTKAHRLSENLAAANLQITLEDLRYIDSAVSSVKVSGERYPAWMHQTVGR